MKLSAFLTRLALAGLLLCGLLALFGIPERAIWIIFGFSVGMGYSAFGAALFGNPVMK